MAPIEQDVRLPPQAIAFAELAHFNRHPILLFRSLIRLMRMPAPSNVTPASTVTRTIRDASLVIQTLAQLVYIDMIAVSGKCVTLCVLVAVM